MSLITNKTYRQIGDGKEWIKAGNNTNNNNTCLRKGMNLMTWWKHEVGNAPTLFRPNWFSQCYVGYHYHPCEVMYFICANNKGTIVA